MSVEAEATAKFRMFKPSKYRDARRLGWAFFIVGSNLLIYIKSGVTIDMTTASWPVQTFVLILACINFFAVIWAWFAMAEEFAKPCRSPLVDEIMENMDIGHVNNKPVDLDK
jgi:hypothetical protein